jgi:hypothetical protein
MRFRPTSVSNPHRDDDIIPKDQHHAVTEQSCSTKHAARFNLTDALKQLKRIAC